MDPDEIQREIFSLDQKIALADLETSKAAERVEELKYQKSCFMVDLINAKIMARKKTGDLSNPQMGELQH